MLEGRPHAQNGWPTQNKLSGIFVDFFCFILLHLDIFYTEFLLVYFGFKFCVFMGFVLCVSCTFLFFDFLCFLFFCYCCCFVLPVCFLKGEKEGTELDGRKVGRDLG